MDRPPQTPEYPARVRSAHTENSRVESDPPVRGLAGAGAPPLLILAICCILFLMLAVGLGEKYRTYRIRKNVSQANWDLRTLGTAIESYMVDYSRYPACTNRRELSPDGRLVPESYPESFTFRIKAGEHDALVTLTTPQAYIHAYLRDPFADKRGSIYRYYRPEPDAWGWIVGSWGPDRDQRSGGDFLWHLSKQDFSRIYEQEERKGPESQYVPWKERSLKVPDDLGIASIYFLKALKPPPMLLLCGYHESTGALTYDVTNGLVSEGDLWHACGSGSPGNYSRVH